jgi:DNA-binding beta-propeller fold protein YncE
VAGGDSGPGGSDVVAVISVSADSVVKDIKAGSGGPQGIAVSPSGRTLYVTNPNAGPTWPT